MVRGVIDDQQRVISAIEMNEDEYLAYCAAKEVLRRILNRHLGPEWTFKDKDDPVIEWDGVRFIRDWRTQAKYG